MNGASIAFVGNLTGDPELRFTPSGAAVAAFSVAVTPRVKDTGSGEWKDGETSFFRVSCWRLLAENVAGSLSKGDRVHVAGSIAQRRWEDKDGTLRVSFDVTADSVGADLAFRPVKVERGARGGAAGVTDDPWAKPVAVPA